MTSDEQALDASIKPKYRSLISKLSSHLAANSLSIPYNKRILPTKNKHSNKSNHV